MMEPELKARWIADLRKYPHLQGQGWLRHNSKYCCLGRLAKVCRVPWDKINKGYNFNGYRAAGVPPNNWEGLTSEILGELIKMNDGLGKNFPEIADYLEATLTI